MVFEHLGWDFEVCGFLWIRNVSKMKLKQKGLKFNEVGFWEIEIEIDLGYCFEEWCSDLSQVHDEQFNKMMKQGKPRERSSTIQTKVKAGYDLFDKNLSKDCIINKDLKVLSSQTIKRLLRKRQLCLLSNFSSTFF